MTNGRPFTRKDFYTHSRTLKNDKEKQQKILPRKNDERKHINTLKTPSSLILKNPLN